MDRDEHWMQRALAEARAAGEAGEVPVGAVVVKDGVLIASGRNSPVAGRDPSAHAEVNALRAAAAALGNYRLDGCELFVTLEPCAMCAGAMLHARVARVVYGAADPKTGAAGSVVDLFGQAQLNHQTAVRGGVLAEQTARPLQAFFRRRRQDARDTVQPLRDDALRTPPARFEGLGGEGDYLSDLPALHGWRLHYLDTGPADASAAVVCLHGWGQWSRYFRHLIAALPGVRVLAPDLVGFGRSDKPKREAVHTLDWHAQVLAQWLVARGVVRAVLVHHPEAAALAERLKAVAPERIAACLPAAGAPADAASQAAWRAPFPDRGHEAALRAFGARDAAADDLPPPQAQALARAAMGYCAP